jgi:hypothetical protein
MAPGMKLIEQASTKLDDAQASRKTDRGATATLIESLAVTPSYSLQHRGRRLTGWTTHQRPVGENRPT